MRQRPEQHPQQLGPAEANTRAALVRIQQLNPLTGAVIAIDPTAIDQARLVDSRRIQGPVAPEDILPGVPYFYASTCRECPVGCGVIVRARGSR